VDIQYIERGHLYSGPDFVNHFFGDFGLQVLKIYKK